MRTAVHRILPPLGRALLVACLAVSPLAAHAQNGFLQRVRDNVRSKSGGSSSQEESKADNCKPKKRNRYLFHSDGNGEITSILAKLAFFVITAPAWGPKAVTSDDWNTEGFFPGYPYDNVPGYMTTGRFLTPGEYFSDRLTNDDDPLAEYSPDDPLPDLPLSFSPLPHTRNWAGRIRFDYADEFDDLDRIAVHLLLSTSSRFGLDTEINRFQETLPGGFHDQLWLGDCNVVFRFAQSDHAQFRTGIGFNWLDDPVATNYGFNFTYGADFYPRKPWIFSATIDWGNLGSAELFRFRTSAGLIIQRFEVYTGYEYLDVDNSQFNGLVGGVRIWF